jgi:UPF0271 protein
MKAFDLNCDLGEIEGPAGEQLDRSIIPQITSANVACGGHAGSSQRMTLVAELCKHHGVRFGAHPGYPDREGFGRVELALSDEELARSLREQLALARDIARSAGVLLTHVKPHGALYNVAARDHRVAELIVRCVQDITPDCEVYALSGSVLIEVAQQCGLKTRSEVFADRNYSSDGSLLPRSHPEAVLHNPEFIARRMKQMVESSNVIAIDGAVVSIVPETFCVHGDTAECLEILKALRRLTNASA